MKFQCQNIGFVVVSNEGKFCCVDEKKGWYLPAGRIDYGETFLTGALRETQEEAGIEVDLEGILWIRYSFSNRGFATVRVYYKGVPKSGEKLKDFSDKESYGAEWLSFEQVKALRDRDEDFLNMLSEIPRIKELMSKNVKSSVGNLRTAAVVDMFEAVEKGSKPMNLSLYHGIDSAIIDPNVRTVKTTAKALILLEFNEKYVISSCILSDSVEDVFIAADVALQKILSVKGMFGKLKSVGKAELVSTLGLYHQPPLSKEVDEFASFSFCFLAKVLSIKKKVNIDWKSIDKLKETTTKDEEFLVSNFENNVVGPLDLFCKTVDEFKILK